MADQNTKTPDFTAYSSATNFLARAKGTGMSADSDTGMVQVSPRGLKGQRLLEFRDRMNAAQTPGTPVNRQLAEERKKLFFYMNTHGEYYTRAVPGGGTKLMWIRTQDDRGRRVKNQTAYRVAQSSRSDLAVEDFRNPVGGDYSSSPFRGDLGFDYYQAERFDRMYQFVMGGVSVIRPNPQEQDALDYKRRMEDAMQTKQRYEAGQRNGGGDGSSR